MVVKEQILVCLLMLGILHAASWDSPASRADDSSPDSKITNRDRSAGLPPDGSWSRCQVAVKRKDQDQEFAYKLTVSSVGRLTDGTKSFRWIELKIDESGENTIVKLLLPEKELLESENPAKHIARGWEKIGADVRAIDSNRAQLYAADLLFLPGPLQSAKPLHEKQVVEYQRGRLEMARGWSGEQEVHIGRGDGKGTFKTRYSVWRHPDIKLGFAAARMTLKFHLNDTDLATSERDYRVEDAGTNAKSELPNYE